MARSIESNILISDLNIIYFGFQGPFRHDAEKKQFYAKLFKKEVVSKTNSGRIVNAARNEPFALKHEGD